MQDTTQAAAFSGTRYAGPALRADMCAARPGPVRSLFISGPGEHYRLGEPMLVHDLAQHLGTMEAPVLSRDRSIVHLGRFCPSPAVDEMQHSRFAPLLLVEAIMFVAKRFHDVGTVHFTLAPPVEMGDGEVVGALSRLALLERAGASDLELKPSPDAAILCSFVVQGTWHYSGFNLAALAGELFEQRSIHSQARCGASAARQKKKDARLWLERQWDRLKP